MACVSALACTSCTHLLECSYISRGICCLWPAHVCTSSASSLEVEYAHTRMAGSRRMRCQARMAWPRASVAPSAASQLQPYLALTRSLPLEEPHDGGDVVLGALVERGGDQLLRRRAGRVGARACSAAALPQPHTHNYYLLLTCCKHAPCCCHRGPVTPAKALPSCITHQAPAVHPLTHLVNAQASGPRSA